MRKKCLRKHTQLQSAMLALNDIYRMLLYNRRDVTVMAVVLIAWIWQSRRPSRP